MTDLKQVSEEVKSNEPDTVQYQITQSDEDENEILIWEEVSPFRHFPSPFRSSPPYIKFGTRADQVVQEQRGSRT
jgi:hypothetical protein